MFTNPNKKVKGLFVYLFVKSWSSINVLKILQSESEIASNCSAEETYSSQDEISESDSLMQSSEETEFAPMFENKRFKLIGTFDGNRKYYKEQLESQGARVCSNIKNNRIDAIIIGRFSKGTYKPPIVNQAEQQNIRMVKESWLAKSLEKESIEKYDKHKIPLNFWRSRNQHNHNKQPALKKRRLKKRIHCFLKIFLFIF